MIECQRHLFDLPEDAAYLNCAYTSPLLKAGVRVGEKALSDKARPWNITSNSFFEHMEKARDLFAQVVGGGSDNVCLIPAVSYGISLAAANTPLEEGRTVVVLADQFPSNVYPWRRLAAERGGRIVTVVRPQDDDWTGAVLQALDERTAVAALPQCHWTDGTGLDLAAVGRRCRELGATLVVDATQSLGAMPFSVSEIQPDFLVTTAHKWLLGPYNYGFCFVADKWLEGRPLEENWINRKGAEDFSRLVDYRDEYRPGARRYDVGEASSFVSAPIAAAALEQILAWGVDEVAETLRRRTDDIARRAEALGFVAPPRENRAPHLIGIKRQGGFDRRLPEMLAEKKVFVSVRGESVRIAPHLYNTDEDVDRLFEVLTGL